MADISTGDVPRSAHRLRTAATLCWRLFGRCIKDSSGGTLLNCLHRDYGKFKIWSGDLGARQGGHASLDWRLKGAEIMENEVFLMLKDLEEDLRECQSGFNDIIAPIRSLTSTRFRDNLRQAAPLRAGTAGKRGVES